jgi:hypothetical protein
MLHEPACVTYGSSSPPLAHELLGVLTDVPLPVVPAGVIDCTSPATRCTLMALYCTAPLDHEMVTVTVAKPPIALVTLPLQTHWESDGLPCVPVDTHDMVTPPVDTVADTPVVPEASETPATIALPTGRPLSGALPVHAIVLLLVVLLAAHRNASFSAAEAVAGAHQVTRIRHDQDSAHVQ